MARAKRRRVSKAREVIDLSRDGELRRCSSDRAATVPTAHARAALPVSGHIKRIGPEAGRCGRGSNEKWARRLREAP
jgi:hypothetical protein